MTVPRLDSLRVLYVEDDDAIRLQLKVLFEPLFKEVLTAENGNEALAVLERNEIDVLLTDLMMPGMDGITLFKTISGKPMEPSVRIIITAHADTRYFLDAIALRVDGYLIKPLHVEMILQLIEDSLRYKNDCTQASDTTEKMILILAAMIRNKKMDIVRYLIKNADHGGVFNGSYEEIMHSMDVSKPTVVETFRDLMHFGLLEKIKNRQYRLKIDEKSICRATELL